MASVRGVATSTLAAALLATGVGVGAGTGDGQAGFQQGTAPVAVGARVDRRPEAPTQLHHPGAIRLAAANIQFLGAAHRSVPIQELSTAKSAGRIRCKTVDRYAVWKRGDPLRYHILLRWCFDGHRIRGDGLRSTVKSVRVTHYVTGHALNLKAYKPKASVHKTRSGWVSAEVRITGKYEACLPKIGPLGKNCFSNNVAALAGVYGDGGSYWVWLH